LEDKDESVNDAMKEKRELHSKFRDDLLKRQLSNNENYDRAILTLSTAALGLTVTFIRNLTTLKCPGVLITAWVCMVLAIMAIVISYPISQKAIDKQLEFAERYYIQDDESAADAKNHLAIYHDIFVTSAGFIFVAGIICILVFFGINLFK
jgi:hypothetical protein